MSGNAILKYRGHAKVTEKVALCLAFRECEKKSVKNNPSMIEYK